MGGEFDFARAEARIRAEVDRVARGAHGDDTSRQLMALRSAADAVAHIERLVLSALSDLPVGFGGLSVSGTWPTFHPLIRLLRRLRAHPSRRDEAADDWAARASALIAQRGTLPWSIRHAIDEVAAGARHFLRNADLPSAAEPWFPTSDPIVRHWMGIFCALVAADELGILGHQSSGAPPA